DRRINELADAEAALARATAAARALTDRLEAADTVAQEQQATWVREKEYVGTRRAELLTQFDEVKDQRDKIERLGPEGECPTCRRPLGAEHAAVLGVLNRQLEAIVENGKYFKQRIEQLAEPPAAVTEAEKARDALREAAREASGRGGAGWRSRAGGEGPIGTGGAGAATGRRGQSAGILGGEVRSGSRAPRPGGACAARGRARRRRDARRAGGG